LGLLLRREIIGDFEQLADFFGGLAFDHICDESTSNTPEIKVLHLMIIEKNKKSVQQRRDVEVIGCKDNFKKHLLIDGDEFLVPFTDLRRSPFYCPGRRKGLATMVFAVCENLMILTKRLSNALDENGNKPIPSSGQGRRHCKGG